jgi:hypothetical protein
MACRASSTRRERFSYLVRSTQPEFVTLLTSSEQGSRGEVVWALLTSHGAHVWPSAVQVA